jgi:sulfate/thiosulfate transport system permease protein
MKAKWALRTVGGVYLAVVLVGPLALVFWSAFRHGLGPFWTAITSPDAVAALKLTLITAAIAVPANTIFGLLAAHLLVRRRFRGRRAFNTLIGLPLALSPVVVGLALVLVWGSGGWFGPWAVNHGVNVIFATPGIVLATIVVSLPFVTRELVPVLRELGVEQQEAAATMGASPLQILWRITLPAVRYGLIYGVVLTTARVIGEFGAVAVVSGNIAGQSQTMTLYVQNQFQQFNMTGAYSASVLLACIAIATVVVLRLVNRRGVR